MREERSRAKRGSSDFGLLLRHFRLAAGLSQAMLAELAQISVDGISALERGCHCTPRRETAALLTRALGLEGESRLEFEASAAHERTAWPRELPFAAASFVGRERELIELASLVEKHRMVTITGPGGIGKTQTAVQVVKRLVESDQLAICAVGLAPIEDPSLVIATIALALALPENPERQVLDTLAAFIRDKALLLVLDNCEQVLDEAANVATTLLAACPFLRILATSREPLNIHEECIFGLPPLSTPGKNIDGLTKREASKYEAIALFCDRASALDHRFGLTDQNAPVVADLCIRLDGIPQSIELAAARATALSLQAGHRASHRATAD